MRSAILNKKGTISARIGLILGILCLQIAVFGPKVTKTEARTALSPILGRSVTRWSKELNYAGAMTGTDPRVLAAIMHVESHGYMHSIYGGILTSPTGALGLMQLEPVTAAYFGVNPYRTWQNILGGARVLRWDLNYFYGNLSLALAAYNAGAGNVGAGAGYAREVLRWVR
jgi:soluble lytic murein transglycosylase-like protein